MAFGHLPFGHNNYGHGASSIVTIKTLFVRAFKAVLDYNKPSIPRAYKATVV